MNARSAIYAVYALFVGAAAALGQGTSPVLKNTESATPEGARLRFGKLAGSRYVGSVYSAVMSIDGKRMGITSSEEATVVLDMESGKVLQRIPNRLIGASSSSLSLSADGRILAIVDFQGTRLLEAATGKLLQQLAQRDVGGQRIGPSISKDGKLIALVTDRLVANREQGELKVHDITTGNTVATFDTLHNYNMRTAIAPDGKCIASWGSYLSRGVGGVGGGVAERESPRTLQLWDLAAKKELRQIKLETNQQYGGNIQSVAFSPDGKFLAVCAGASTFHLLEFETGKEIRRFAGLRSPGSTTLTFSPDGKMLLAHDQGGTLQGWEVGTGKRLPLADAPRVQVVSVAFPAKDRVVAAGILSGSLIWWEATDLASPFEGHLAPLASLAFTPDGRSLITAGNDQRLFWWDVQTGKEQRQARLLDDDPRFSNLFRATAFALAPDGIHAATQLSGGNTIRLWNLKAGRPVCDFDNPRNYSAMTGLSFSPDSSKLATAGSRSTVQVWDCNSGQDLSPRPQQQMIPGGSEPISRVAFSNDGALVAVHESDRFGARPGAKLVIWDVAKKSEKLSIDVPLLTTTTTTTLLAGGMAFSRDDRLLAVAEPTGMIVLYHVNTGKEWRRLGSTRTSSLQLAFSPDGRFLAVGTSPRTIFTGIKTQAEEPVVEIWELASGQKRETLKGHAGGIACLAFSANGSLLATGSLDTTAILWDMTGRSHRKLPAVAENELAGVWRGLLETTQDTGPVLRRLAQSPETTLPFLQKDFMPAKGNTLDEKTLDRLVADLDSGNFLTRETAMKTLKQHRERAEGALKRGLASNRSLEAIRRIRDLLDGLVIAQITPEDLRAARAVEVLERIGTPEAMAFLRAHAEGDGATRATQEARAALKRLRE